MKVTKPGGRDAPWKGGHSRHLKRKQQELDALRAQWKAEKRLDYKPQPKST